MSAVQSQEAPQGVYVKLLCLLLASLILLSVSMERPGEAKVTVPVRLSHLPAGLRLVGASQDKAEVTIAAPRILLVLLRFRDLSCNVDLTGAAAGTVAVSPQEVWFDLPDRDMKVIQVFPKSLQVTLAAGTK